MLRSKVYNTFDKQAAHYEEAAKVQYEIGERLFARLDYLKITPRRVLDLGCGSGLFTLKLKKYYPKAQVIGFDLAAGMLKESQKKQRWWRQWPLIQGDMTKLPFLSGSFDLIFSNQVIHWASEFSPVFQELNRIMTQEACLIFSTLGPDTFKELRKAWMEADHYAHTHDFFDMHDVGDILLKEQMRDPVMDREELTVHYSSLKQLVTALKLQGVQNANKNRNKGLTGKESWRIFESNYHSLCTTGGKYPLTYEVVYGHAWKGNLPNQKGEVFFPLSQLKTSLTTNGCD